MKFGAAFAACMVALNVAIYIITQEEYALTNAFICVVCFFVIVDSIKSTKRSKDREEKNRIFFEKMSQYNKRRLR